MADELKAANAIKGMQKAHFKNARKRTNKLQQETVYKHPLATELQERMENTNELLKNLETNENMFSLDLHFTENDLIELEKPQS